MKIIIDRFEDDIAICEKEDSSLIKIEKYKLPNTAKEGTIVVIDNDKIIVDEKVNKNKKYKIQSILDDLFS